jgi:hypothetical protein
VATSQNWKRKKKEKQEKLGATSYYLLGNLLEFFFKIVNLTFIFSNFLKSLANFLISHN